MTDDVLKRYGLDQPLTEEEKLLWSEVLRASKDFQRVQKKTGLAFIEREGKIFCLLEMNERVDQIIFVLAKTADRLIQDANQLAWGLIAGAWGLALRLALVTWRLSDDNTLTCINNLAASLENLGRPAKALLLYELALNRTKEVLGKRHPDTLSTLNNLASCLQSLGRSVEALPLYEQTLRLSREVLGECHPDTLSTLNNLASCLDRLGRSAEALPLYEQALKLSWEVLGDRHPHTIATLNNLAGCLEILGRWTEALPLYEQVLTFTSETLGERHPYTLGSLNNLVVCMGKIGHSAQALSLYEHVLTYTIEVLGAHHSQTLTCLNNLASLLQSLERSEEALPLYRNALSRTKEVLGEGHPDTILGLSNLATCLDSLGRWAEALPFFVQALNFSKEALGAQHPDTLGILNSLALCLDERAQDESKKYQARDRLVEATQAHIQTPWRYRGWFEAIPAIAGRLARHINEGRYPNWQPMFDSLSQELADTLETQVEQMMDHTYQCSADFHARYLNLCLRHGQTMHIPTVLSRIHAPKLAALVWDKLAENPPENLGEVEKEFLKVRRDLALLRLSGARIIEGGRGQGLDERSPTSTDAEQAAALERQRAVLERQRDENRQRQIETLLDRYRTLRGQLGEQFRQFLNPDASLDALNARLQPGQAILLLIDLPFSDAPTVPPFALLLRYDRDTLFAVEALPKLDQLSRLLAHGRQVSGQRSGYRDGSGIVPEPAEEKTTGEQVPSEETDDFIKRDWEWLSHTIKTWREFIELSHALREPKALQDNDFGAWINDVTALSVEMESLENMDAETSADPALQAARRERLAELVQRAKKELSAYPLEIERAEQAALMKKYLWEPLQEGLGKALDGIDTLYWVTHGRLHTLPYDLDRPGAAPARRLYHYPGTLFLRPAAPRAGHAQVWPTLIHAHHSPKQNPIPFVLTEQAIAEYFMGQKSKDALKAISESNASCRIQKGFVSLHGDQHGYMHVGDTPLAWQEWITRNHRIDDIYLSACLLGRTDEQHGEPLGWVAALLLQDSDTVIAALAPIPDFYAPLLTLLFMQARHHAKDRKPKPEDALREAKRRLLNGEWYQSNELDEPWQTETTAELVKRFYPIGMEETLRLIENGNDPVKLIAGWYLPSQLRKWIRFPPAIALSKVKTGRQALVNGTLERMIVDPKGIGKEAAVQSLVSAVVCFGKTPETT